MGLLDAVEPALDAGAGILNLLHALDKGGNGTTLTMRHIALIYFNDNLFILGEKEKRKREIIEKTEDGKKERESENCDEKR